MEAIEYMTGPDAAERAGLRWRGSDPRIEHDLPFFPTPDADAVNSIAEYVESNREPHAYEKTGSRSQQDCQKPARRSTLNRLSGSEFITERRTQRTSKPTKIRGAREGPRGSEHHDSFCW